MRNRLSMRERKMVGDMGKVGIKSQSHIPDKNSPIAAFGEKRLAVVAAQDLPPARFTSIGSIETHIKTFEELSVTSLKDLTSDEITDVQSHLNSLKQIETELDSTQQSMLRTVVNHLQFALDTNSSAQRFILGQAKKELEKLQSNLEVSQQNQGSTPIQNESSKLHSAWLAIKEFLSFLSGLVFKSENPSPEIETSEPEPVPVLVQEQVIEAPKFDSTNPEFLAGKQAISDKLNEAINTLPTAIEGVSYHEATEAGYEQTYQDLKQELDQFRKSYKLDVPKNNDDHPLFGEYKKLRSYQEKITQRVEALKKQKPVVPKVISPEDAAADDEFTKAAKQATRQGFKGQVPR